ncbi:cytochrome P450 [Lentzea sp. NBRC 105346]|uniref:cytochrome P450 n=1 Tax=Lentzea sp. NBRC 105346 TaxID=3032205 RepID=UPI0024A31411|nr:cytochrome P450 [Lentzea sp. NBRC 105346]GLZ35217.1 cytochrome P450 [Lentzea sp. NBRC 105346]
MLTRLRNKIFERVNGTEGVRIPGDLVGVEHFHKLYAHPAATGRSRGAGLSDLFWYWLAPGPEVHQEHLEPGFRYDEVARCTRRFLAKPLRDSEKLAAEVAGRVLDEHPVRLRLVRLRDEMMPIWAEFYYELVFGTPCPRRARDLIVANAEDVVGSLKCTRLRHMDRRRALTSYLRGRNPVVPLPASLTPDEQVFWLQGTFFNTAVVQSSEAMAHLLLALAQQPDTQRRVRDEPELLDEVISETMWRWPLFGIAHRITSAEIKVDEGVTLPAGSVLLFDYVAFQSASRQNHIPFGVTANRPCPAKGIVPPTMRAVAREVLARYELSSTAAHERPLPNRGPCLLQPRDAVRPARMALAYLRVRDRFEDLTRGIVQLVLGTAMVLHARKLRLAERYFETHDSQGRPL